MMLAKSLSPAAYIALCRSVSARIRWRRCIARARKLVINDREMKDFTGQGVKSTSGAIMEQMKNRMQVSVLPVFFSCFMSSYQFCILVLFCSISGQRYVSPQNLDDNTNTVLFARWTSTHLPQAQRAAHQNPPTELKTLRDKVISDYNRLRDTSVASSDLKPAPLPLIIFTYETISRYASAFFFEYSNTPKHLVDLLEKPMTRVEGFLDVRLRSFVPLRSDCAHTNSCVAADTQKEEEAGFKEGRYFFFTAI
jgi:hypothetical protein